MKKILIALTLMTGICFQSKAIDLPRDIVNTELAISFHKEQIKLLNERIVQAEVMREIQTENTKKTSKLVYQINT